MADMVNGHAIVLCSLVSVYKTFELLQCTVDDISIDSPQHKYWPTGPAHFSDRRASTGQYIVPFTGPAGPLS